MDDRLLLRAYARDRSEEAFAELVKRHLGLVYSAALRQLRDPAQAQDAAQAVFLILARKAESLPSGTILSGWLYRTARFVSLEAMRGERRRKLREETVAKSTMADETGDSGELWQQVAPHLDHAMDRLSDTDRNAIVLRFLQGRTLAELGATLGIGEEAAKKRVARALDRLRGILKRNGITSPSSALGAALAAYAAQPAPAALGAAIGSAAAQAAAASSVQILAEGALHMIAWTKIKTAAVGGAALLLMTGAATVTVDRAKEERRHARLSAERHLIAAQTITDTADTRAALAAMERENRELREQALELHRLRNTAAQLRASRSATSSSPGLEGLEDAPPELRESAERLRELQYQQFIAAGQQALALNPLPEKERVTYVADIDFLKQAALALRIYASNNGDEFPATLEKLYETDLLTESQKEKLRGGRYQYIVFKNAESKPQLPAFWWPEADERGIRLAAMNDGSVQMMRDPAGIKPPGAAPLAGNQ